MPTHAEAIKHLLILGESNSVYTDGWVAGLQDQTQESVEISNSSLGSSGIFNAIYKLVGLGETLAEYDVVLFDTCIQDASFYCHRNSDYFEILEELIQYLQSHGIDIGYLQFEKLNKETLEQKFYIQLRQFLEARNVTVWNINELIFKYSDIKDQSELHFAYADPHHIKQEVAFNVGKIVGHDINQELGNRSKRSPTSTRKMELNFGLIDASHIQQSFNSKTSQLHTSLFQSKTLLVSKEEITIPVPTQLQGQEIIGILFNANNANGVLHIQSENSLSKNLANNSKLYWQSPLVWSRPLHHPVTLNKTLCIKVISEDIRVEQTEYCHPDFTDKNALLSIEIVGFITRRKQTNTREIAPTTSINQATKNKIAKLFSQAQFKEVIQFIEQVLPENQGSSFLWKAYGAALLQTANANEAIEALQKSIYLCSDDVEAHNALAVAYQQCQRFDAAERHFVHAITLAPKNFEALYNIADMYFARQQHDKAFSYFSQALLVKADFVDALIKRGIALHYKGNFEEAAQDFMLAIAKNPQSHEAHCNLGNALKSMQRIAEAEHNYLRAIELNKSFVDAHSNLSHLQSDTRRYEDAFESAKIALQINPRHIGALNNMALAQRGLGKVSDAVLALRKALEISPDYDEAKINLAYLLLSQGQFNEGWYLHESRHSKTNSAGLVRQFTPDSLPWEGQSIKGKTLIIFPEQGLGDQIQFVRYVTVLEEMGVEKIYLYCIEPLLELFSHLRNECLTPFTGTQSIPRCDYHTFLMSLPYLCQTRFESIPNQVPYLGADTQLSQQIERQLSGISAFKVGLCWLGSNKYKYDAERSLELATLRPLNTLPGVLYFNLQKDSRLSFLNLFHENAYDFGHEIDAHTPPFKETAALIANLDLVITCDTAVGHLAGALGKRVWLLQPFVADWRWGNAGQSTPWYPHTRLFRQTATRSWNEVITHVCAELKTELVPINEYSSKSLSLSSAIPATASNLLIPISLGEFFDKISILEIKRQRISDPRKLGFIDVELNELIARIPPQHFSDEELRSLRLKLKEINEELWDIEDSLRQIETTNNFDDRFVELARNVYKKNDLRAQIKYAINTLTNSTLREEKSYSTTPANNIQLSPATR